MLNASYLEIFQVEMSVFFWAGLSGQSLFPSAVMILEFLIGSTLGSMSLGFTLWLLVILGFSVELEGLSWTLQESHTWPESLYQLHTATVKCKMEEDHLEMPHLRSLRFFICSLPTTGSLSVTSLSHSCEFPTSLVPFGTPWESEPSLLVITRRRLWALTMYVF